MTKTKIIFQCVSFWVSVSVSSVLNKRHNKHKMKLHIPFVSQFVVFVRHFSSTICTELQKQKQKP